MKPVFDEKSFLPFTNLVNDTNDLYRLIEEIKGINRFLFRVKKVPVSIKAKEFLSPQLQAIFEKIENLGLEPEDDSTQADFLRALLEYLKSLPLVKTTLAFDPSASFIARMNKLITDEVGKKVVLDFTVDETIVGGLILEYQGKYFEGTIESLVEKSIEKMNLFASPSQAASS